MLRKVASHIGTIVQGYDVTDTTVYPAIESALRRYAETLDEWARQLAGRMLIDVALRDQTTWLEYAQDLSAGIKQEIRQAPTGQVMQELLGEQVGLIKSIPLDAAKRVQELAIKAVEEGGRGEDIIAMLLKSRQVAIGRANTIARTEISRAASAFTEARARHLGSEGYIWRTMGDSDVRHDHQELEGKFIRWDSPPIADKKKGVKAHAGCIYNCRCYPEPVIPETVI